VPPASSSRRWHAARLPWARCSPKMQDAPKRPRSPCAPNHNCSPFLEDSKGIEKLEKSKNRKTHEGSNVLHHSQPAQSNVSTPSPRRSIFSFQFSFCILQSLILAPVFAKLPCTTPQPPTTKQLASRKTHCRNCLALTPCNTYTYVHMRDFCTTPPQLGGPTATSQLLCRQPLAILQLTANNSNVCAKCKTHHSEINRLHP
jgi:hypothetical protein